MKGVEGNEMAVSPFMSSAVVHVSLFMVCLRLTSFLPSADEGVREGRCGWVGERRISAGGTGEDG